MANYARGYSVFDAVRARVRSQALGRVQSQATSQATQSGVEKSYGTKPGGTGLVTGIPGAVGTGMYDSPFMESPDTVFTQDLETGAVNVEPITETTMSAPFGQEKLTGAEAGAKANLGYYGPYDPNSTFGRAANSFIAAIDPTPFGFFGGLLSGTTTVDPYGRTAAKPVGSLGVFAEMNIENQYEIAEKIKAGTPGFHQFYSGGQLVSIVPQTIFGKEVGYATLGTFSGSSQDAINQYAASMGYDPETVNLASRPGMKGFGRELDAFVPGSGGFREDGRFVDVSGRSTSIAGADLEAHLGLTADIYGIPKVVDTINKMGVSKDVANQMMQSLRSGELTAQAVVDKNGNTVGYNTGSGSVVRSGDGSIVTSGSGSPVTSGAGIMSTSLYESLKAESQFMAESDSSGDSGAGIGDFSTNVPGYTTVSGGDGDGRGSGSDTFFGGSDYDPGFDDGDTGDTGGDTSGGYGSDPSGGAAGSPFAEGGEVPPDQVPPGEAPVAAQAGFIGQEPEGLPDGMTVADDVPLEVPEGTFVLNAAAVEFMGSADVKKMILEAMQEAEKQGIDIKQDNAKIAKEDLVSLVVSKGEVIIPPQLAEIIGYDRLNKINNRGKAEVERRVQESEQQEAPAPKPPILAKSGGFISKPS